jgi:predicted ATPase
MMLLERDPALASLRQYAHEAGQGEGRLVLIAGEAGAGKSEQGSRCW